MRSAQFVVLCLLDTSTLEEHRLKAAIVIDLLIQLINKKQELANCPCKSRKCNYFFTDYEKRESAVAVPGSNFYAKL